MNTPIVYVVQSPPLIVDRETGERHPKFSLGAAEKFGHLEYLVPNENWTHKGQDPQGLIELMRPKLSRYRESDYLLLIGAPHVIAIAVLLAGHATGGRLKFLLWQRLHTRYEPVEVIL